MCELFYEAVGRSHSGGIYMQDLETSCTRSVVGLNSSRMVSGAPRDPLACEHESGSKTRRDNYTCKYRLASWTEYQLKMVVIPRHYSGI